jgi:hypothetical protein
VNIVIPNVSLAAILSVTMYTSPLSRLKLKEYGEAKENQRELTMWILAHVSSSMMQHWSAPQVVLQLGLDFI